MLGSGDSVANKTDMVPAFSGFLFQKTTKFISPTATAVSALSEFTTTAQSRPDPSGGSALLVKAGLDHRKPRMDPLKSAC